MKVCQNQNTYYVVVLLLACVVSISVSAFTFKDDIPTPQSKFPVPVPLPPRPQRDSTDNTYYGTTERPSWQSSQATESPSWQTNQDYNTQQRKQQFQPPPLPNIANTRQSVVNPVLQELAAGNTKFSLNMFKHLAEAIPQNDFMFSPFTVYSLLTTLVEGASNPSETLNELLNVLEIPRNALQSLGDIYDEIYKKLTVKTDNVVLSVFQGIFHNYTHGLQPQYKDIVENKYHTQITEYQSGKTVDQVLQTINNIVRQGTNGNLQSAFRKSEINSAPMLMLSAIHFKGNWANPFNRSYTKTEPFYDEFGNTVGNVQMMFERAAIAFAPIKELESHVIQLPYGSENRLGMIVLLPRKNVSLTEVADKLSGYSLTEMFKVLDKSLIDFEDDEIEVHLPKFSTNTDLALNMILAKMGLQSIFSSDAQLGKMNPNIFLSKLIHKAKIEVDEEGTVASAVTGGVFANKSSAPRFYANRPFLYLIVDRETNLILFCGQMRNQAVPPRQSG